MKRKAEGASDDVHAFAVRGDTVDVAGERNERDGCLCEVDAGGGFRGAVAVVVGFEAQVGDGDDLAAAAVAGGLRAGRGGAGIAEGAWHGLAVGGEAGGSWGRDEDRDLAVDGPDLGRGFEVGREHGRPFRAGHPLP